MGLLDNLKDLASDNIPGAQSGINAFDQLKKTVLPPELTNLQNADKLIQEKITEITTELGQGVAQAGQLTGIRTLLEGHFNHLRQGGEPQPQPMVAMQIKAMPVYQTLCQHYPILEHSLSQLEEQHQGCTYGFRQSDNSIVKADLAMPEEQLSQLRNQAADQTPRCWRRDDPTQYV